MRLTDGFMQDEARKLLHAWAKLYAESRGLSKGDVSLMLFRWTTELAFIRAKGLAKCIAERAALCAEKQDNIDGICGDVRPPIMPHQLHVFTAR